MQGPMKSRLIRCTTTGYFRIPYHHLTPSIRLMYMYVWQLFWSEINNLVFAEIDGTPPVTSYLNTFLVLAQRMHANITRVRDFIRN